ncbi:hypothetical protein [Citrobacter braakii]|uniref:hypothetical protein n=1 Tax=Citrobacter braakii TaxID=57706 RepID=UPI00351D41F5
MNIKTKLTILSTLLTMANLGNYAQASISLPTHVTATINIGAELEAPVPTFVANDAIGTKIPTLKELGVFSYTNTNQLPAKLLIEAEGESVSGKSGQGTLHNKNFADKIYFNFISPDGVNRLNGLSTKTLEPNEVADIKLLSANTQQVRPGVYTFTAMASVWN